MTKATVIKFPGIHRRTDSGIFQFGLRAPVDLLQHFPSGWAIRCSLRTADLRTANNKAKALQTEWVQKFESLRSGNPVPVDLDRIRAELHARFQELLRKVDEQYVGLSSAERQEVADSLRWQLGEARDAVAGRYVPDWAEPWLLALNIPRSPLADVEAMAHLVMVIEIKHEALSDESRTFPLRVKGIQGRRALLEATQYVAPTFGAGSVSVRSTGKEYRISDALAVWGEATRPTKTVVTFARHAQLFSKMMGDPCLSAVDKTLAIEFRDKLQGWAVSESKTARTADNVLVSIRALVNIAKDKGWLDGNVFERLSVVVGGKDSEGREPWTHQELGVLFADPIWAEHRLPEDRKAGADAAYWIPLIACYSGARVSEIAQLWTDDVELNPGKEVIEFRPSAERGQVLKTSGSWRAVPIHSELIRLGLREYVASLPTGYLFPNLPIHGQNGAGGQFAQWFGDFKRSKGFDSSSKTLHSFRHLVATELRLMGATDPQADAITGHAGNGVGRTTYSATIRRSAERLRAVIEMLRYDALKSLPSKHY